MRKQGQALIESGPVPLTPENFEAQLIRAIIGCHWSISTVNNIEFKRLVQSINKDIKIPSSTTVTRRILEYRINVEEQIKASLPEDPTKIAIALDCWSAPRREGYIAIKAYWITREWRLAEALIGFEPVSGHHTGDALGRIVIA